VPTAAEPDPEGEAELETGPEEEGEPELETDPEGDEPAGPDGDEE